MSKDSIVFSKSKIFARRIVRAYKFLTENKREFVMSKQLLRSGTSIGANVAEALRACSERDFLNKLYIAYKEAGETEYWLDLLADEDYLSQAQHIALTQQLHEVDAMLASATKTLRTRLDN